MIVYGEYKFVIIKKEEIGYFLIKICIVMVFKVEVVLCIDFLIINLI